MGRPKQFIELLGAPALLYTLRAFEEAPSISRIYAVGDRPRVESLARAARISKFASCAEPGVSRSLSTKSGLLRCEEDPRTLVLVHDGSRCLVTPELVERVVEAASAAPLSNGASGSRPGDGLPDGVVPALPVSDTVKVVEGGTVEQTLDRSRLYAVQTPQAFSLGTLNRVHAGPDELLLKATDDSSLVEGAGGRVAVVQGEKTNIKLTSPEDLVFAEAILRARTGARAGGRAGSRIGAWR